jgi:hypothetical protein
MDRRRHRPAAAAQTHRSASRLLWIGVNVLLFGSGPLIAITIAASLGWTIDPNPHPTGPSLLALLTFWPAVGLIIAGVITTSRRGRSEHS